MRCPSLSVLLGVVAAATFFVGSGQAAGQDQSALVIQKATLNDQKLMSIVHEAFLAGFNCAGSDYKNMTVCTEEKTDGPGDGAIHHSLTVNFDRDSRKLFYIFSYLYQKPGDSLGREFEKKLMSTSKLIGKPQQTLQMVLPGDQHPSRIVVWGATKLSQIGSDDVNSYLAGSLRSGYLVDYSLNIPYSAEHGFPIFATSGGAGLILNYRIDNDRTQRLAIRLVVPNAFLGTEEQTAQVELNYAPNKPEEQFPSAVLNPPPDEESNDPSLLETCVSSGDIVKRILAGELTNKNDAVTPFEEFITLDDDFTVNANNLAIKKVTCAVTAEIDVRRVVGKLAESGDMRSAAALNNVVRRQGAIVSRRLDYTVQPTSKAGEVWVQLAPFR